jgi:epoxyqueuosine reductase
MNGRVTSSLRALIEERAAELGFAGVGFTATGSMSDTPHLRTWLEKGYEASMSWMHKHQELREDSRLLHSGARTIIALSAPYPGRVETERGALSIASYAVSDDYHEVMRASIQTLGAFVRAESGQDVDFRATVDSAPVMERNVAVDAGLGWLGKSAMVLSRSSGTYTLLGELFVDMELDEMSAPMPDYCGRCTACLDACPTGAIVAPFQVDSSKCISYLTIEHRGPIPRALRPLIGDHLFGCDICQDVCPWNNKAEQRVFPGLEARQDVLAVTAEDVLKMSPQEFNRAFAGSPMKRTKRRGLARNACIVLGNRGDPASVPMLAEVLAKHDESLVRSHAAWALGRLGGVHARRALGEARMGEGDSFVREEIESALAMGG